MIGAGSNAVPGRAEVQGNARLTAKQPYVGLLFFSPRAAAQPLDGTIRLPQLI